MSMYVTLSAQRTHCTTSRFCCSLFPEHIVHRHSILFLDVPTGGAGGWWMGFSSVNENEKKIINHKVYIDACIRRPRCRSSSCRCRRTLTLTSVLLLLLLLLLSPLPLLVMAPARVLTKAQNKCWYFFPRSFRRIVLLLFYFRYYYILSVCCTCRRVK